MTSNSSSINANDLALGGVVMGCLNQALLSAGVVGNALCIVVFSKLQANSYKLQVAVMVSEMLNCVAYFASTSDVYYFNFVTNKKTPYALARSYFIMFYICHIMFPVINVFNTATTFLLIAICTDRIVAIAKPFYYYHADPRKRNILLNVIIAMSFGLGVCVNIFDGFRWYPVYQPSLDVYYVLTDTVYVQSTFATFSNFARAALRIIGSIVLIIGNSVVRYLYNKSQANAQSEQRREHSEVIRLLIVQSVLILMGHMFITTFYMILYVYPWLAQTLEYEVVRMLGAVFISASSSIGFAIYLSVSKEFRRKFVNIFKNILYGPSKRQSSVLPTMPHT